MWNRKPFNLGWEIQLCDTTISSKLLELSDRFLVFLEDGLMLKGPLFSAIWDSRLQPLLRGWGHESPWRTRSHCYHIGTPREVGVGHALKAFWVEQWTKGATTKRSILPGSCLFYGTLMTATYCTFFWMISRDTCFWKPRPRLFFYIVYLTDHFVKVSISYIVLWRWFLSSWHKINPWTYQKPSMRGHRVALTHSKHQWNNFT